MNELVPYDRNKDQTSKLLRDSVQGLVEGMTGLAVSERKDLLLSLSYIFQRSRSGSFLSEVIGEWERYREKGRIKDNYAQSEQHQECLREMLDFLDHDAPDAVRFRMLKAIFLGAATETQSKRDSVLPQQYMTICRTLTSGEAIILQATFAIVERGSPKETKMHASAWVASIAKESGLESPELVEIHEKGLIEKMLLTKRTHADLSGVRPGEHYRLTSLGLRICKFIKTFEDEKLG